MTVHLLASMRGPVRRMIIILPENKCSYEILPCLWRLLIESSGQRCLDVECHLNFYTPALHNWHLQVLREAWSQNLAVPWHLANTFVLHCISASPDRRQSWSQTQGSNVPGSNSSANTVSLVQIVTHCTGVGPTEEAKRRFLRWTIATWKGISCWLKECGKIVNLDVSWYPLFVRDSFENYLTQELIICHGSEKNHFISLKVWFKISCVRIEEEK